MKIVTLQELEEHFDEIMDDVEQNKQHYQIDHTGGAVMLIPFESYDVLKDVYQEWVEQPQKESPEDQLPPADPPMSYVCTAETGKI